MPSHDLVQTVSLVPQQIGTHTYLTPLWPAPKHVLVRITTRINTKNQSQGFDLAHQTLASPAKTQPQRAELCAELQLTAPLFWLKQSHSNHVTSLDDNAFNQNADASHTSSTNKPCVILTADCLPILLTNYAGTTVCAIHAGWRGLANGIIANTLAQIKSPAKDIIAWIGAGICKHHYLINEEHKNHLQESIDNTTDCFSLVKADMWSADLYQMAALQLNALGVQSITHSKLCTYENESFYSYRFDKTSKRQASLIWIGR